MKKWKCPKCKEIYKLSIYQYYDDYYFLKSKICYYCKEAKDRVLRKSKYLLNQKKIESEEKMIKDRIKLFTKKHKIKGDELK